MRHHRISTGEKSKLLNDKAKHGVKQNLESQYEGFKKKSGRNDKTEFDQMIKCG